MSDDPTASKLAKAIIARRKMRKGGERVRVAKVRLRYVPRQIVVTPDLLGMFARVKRGKGYYNLRFESAMLGLRVGSLTHTRAKSPIKTPSKNR
jgi:ribosomal protein S19